MDNSLTPERRQELESILRQMREISKDYYSKAVHVSPQCHAFIEICGIMNEYIQICATSLSHGVDFAQCNTHSKTKSLVVYDYQVDYLKEKITCIFDNCIDIQMKALPRR